MNLYFIYYRNSAGPCFVFFFIYLLAIYHLKIHLNFNNTSLLCQEVMNGKVSILHNLSLLKELQLLLVIILYLINVCALKTVWISPASNMYINKSDFGLFVIRQERTAAGIYGQIKKASALDASVVSCT